MSLRIKEDELELIGLDGGGIAIYHYQGKPFTGIMLEYDDHDDSILYCEQEYINGYLEGWYRSYYPNGTKDEEYQSHNNVLVGGTYKHWDEHGKLIRSS